MSAWHWPRGRMGGSSILLVRYQREGPCTLYKWCWMTFLSLCESSAPIYLKPSLAAFPFIHSPCSHSFPCCLLGKTALRWPCFGSLHLEKSFQAKDFFPIVQSWLCYSSKEHVHDYELRVIGNKECWLRQKGCQGTVQFFVCLFGTCFLLWVFVFTKGKCPISYFLLDYQK